MPKVFKKLLLSFLAAFVLLMSFAPAMPSKAADTWYSSGFPGWYAKVYGGDQTEIFGERYTAAQVQWVFYGFLSMILNWVLTATPCTQGQVANLINGSFTGCGGNQGGILPVSLQKEGVASAGKSFISMLFSDRPLSGITYVKNIARKFQIIPQANAQTPGFGYKALDPILPLWESARNVSYGLFVVVILVMAFMIMFRVKISPQVVVSVQSSLPKIAIGLILVTFSYAIAGFLIDMMYVVIGLISLIFAGTSFSAANNSIGLFTILTRGFSDTGVFGFLLLYLVEFVASFFIISVSMMQNIIASFTAAANNGSGLVVGTLAGGGFLFFAILIDIVLVIVLFFVLLWMAIRILITLIKAFAMILFLTILLPLQVTFGVVVPGIGFGTWIRQFVANLAVFPITGVLFMMSFIFMETGMSYTTQHTSQIDILNGVIHIPANTFGNPGWPPLLGISSFGIALVFLIASFFIISLVPKSAEVANGLITGKFALGSAIGEAVGTPLGFAMNAVNAYRAPEKAAFEAQIKQALEQGGLTPAQKTQLRVSQAAQQTQNLAGKVFKG